MPLNALQRQRQVDPTRTLTLRRRYARALRARFRAVEAAIRARFLRQDAQQLPDEAAVLAFVFWLRQRFAADVEEIALGIEGRVVARTRWQDRYLQAAAFKAVLDATNSLRRLGLPLSQESTETALALPVHAEAIRRLVVRDEQDLHGIVEATVQAVSHTLLQSDVAILSTAVLLRRILRVVRTVGVTRARVMAQTSIIGAYAEGTLNELARQGIREVTAQAEVLFTTAGDSHVCKRCRQLAQTRFTIARARGVIPVHARCRCKWQVATRKALP